MQVIVEHFRDNVMGLLGGQAKAMVVSSSRKEAVRYKPGFDKYISEKGCDKLYSMVPFSGDVEFNPKAPNSAGLPGEKFNPANYKDEAGTHLIEATAWNGTPEMVEFLLDSGAEIRNALLRAIVNDKGKERIVEMLLERGANPNHRDKYHTALELSRMKGSTEVENLLLSHGANDRV